ncbi:hypothetical protein D3C86_2135620 [compost metagenome]
MESRTRRSCTKSAKTVSKPAKAKVERKVTARMPQAVAGVALRFWRKLVRSGGAAWRGKDSGSIAKVRRAARRAIAEAA